MSYKDTLAIYEVIEDMGLENNASTVLLTHIAMASTRIEQGNIVGKMDENILTDIMNYEYIEEVKELGNTIGSICHVNIPEEEMDFIYLHLCNVIRESKEK